MAVITKFKIYKSGKVEAGEFVEDANEISMKANGEFHVKELDETGSVVKFAVASGRVIAGEFEEV